MLLRGAGDEGTDERKVLFGLLHCRLQSAKWIGIASTISESKSKNRKQYFAQPYTIRIRQALTILSLISAIMIWTSPVGSLLAKSNIAFR